MTPNGWTTGVAAGLVCVLALGLLAGIAAGQSPPAGTTRPPRPYEGAPPLVPHDVEGRRGLCQECHATGAEGAPITPHPDRVYVCVQCHVGQDTTITPFVPSAWRR